MNDLVLSIMLVKEFMFQTFKRHHLNICSVFKLHKQYEFKILCEKITRGNTIILSFLKNNDRFCNIKSEIMK